MYCRTRVEVLLRAQWLGGGSFGPFNSFKDSFSCAVSRLKGTQNKPQLIPRMNPEVQTLGFVWACFEASWTSEQGQRMKDAGLLQTLVRRDVGLCMVTAHAEENLLPAVDRKA